MKLYMLLNALERRAREIREAGGDPTRSEIMIETIDDQGDFVYEKKFGLFVDDNNDIGLSPMH